MRIGQHRSVPSHSLPRLSRTATAKNTTLPLPSTSPLTFSLISDIPSYTTTLAQSPSIPLASQVPDPTALTRFGEVSLSILRSLLHGIHCPTEANLIHCKDAVPHTHFSAERCLVSYGCCLLPLPQDRRYCRVSDSMALASFGQIEAFEPFSRAALYCLNFQARISSLLIYLTIGPPLSAAPLHRPQSPSPRQSTLHQSPSR